VSLTVDTKRRSTAIMNATTAMISTSVRNLKPYLRRWGFSPIRAIVVDEVGFFCGE
jgi:hypothetical protein